MRLAWPGRLWGQPPSELAVQLLGPSALVWHCGSNAGSKMDESMTVNERRTLGGGREEGNEGRASRRSASGAAGLRGGLYRACSCFESAGGLSASRCLPLKGSHVEHLEPAPSIGRMLVLDPSQHILFGQDVQKSIKRCGLHRRMGSLRVSAENRIFVSCTRL